MSLIRSRGNKATELRLITIFRGFGITGWRRNQALLGKPDFTFRRERDRLVSRELRSLGWQVVRIWQHQLDKHAHVAGRVIRTLESA